jgi:hypothetical protein
VAKLAIIEDQWADEYRLLRDDPSLLGEWHQRADAPHEEGQQSSLPSDLEDFLRLTDHIQPDNLAPYLTLKQTTVEVELPEFATFSRLLEGGNADGIASFLEAQGKAEERAKYIAAVEDYFGQLVRKRAWGAAHNVLRLVVELPALSGDSQLTASILDEGLSQPNIRNRLTAVSAERLVEVGAIVLREARFSRLLDELLDVFGQPENTKVRTGTSAALAGVFDRLSERHKRAIRIAFSTDEELRRDFGSYATLAEAAPLLFPAAALDDAVNALEPFPSPLRDETGEPVAAFRVAKALILGLETSVQSRVEKLLTSAWNALNQQRAAGDEAFNDSVSDLLPIITKAKDLALTRAVVEAIHNEWTSLAAPLRFAAFALAVEFVRAGPEDVGSQFGPGLVHLILEEDRERALEWLDEHYAFAPPSIREPFLERLAATASADGSGDADEHAAALTRLGEGPAKQGLSQAVRLAITGGRWQRAGQIVAQFETQLGEQRDSSIAELVSALPQVDGGSRLQIIQGLHAIGLRHLDSDQRSSVADHLADSIIAVDEGAVTVFDTVEADSGFTSEAPRIVRRVFEHVQGNVSTLSGELDALRFVVDRQGHLEPSQHDRLGVILVDAPAQHPASVAGFSVLIGDLENFEPNRRLDFVQKLIASESGMGDLADREALLAGAKRLAGARPSNSRDAIRDRLKELKNSEDESVRAMAERVEDADARA